MNILHEGAARELGAIVGNDPRRDPEAAHQSFKNLIADCAVTFLTGSTSGHFVNFSIATNKNSKPPVARGKGPTISSPQTENDHDKGIV